MHGVHVTFVAQRKEMHLKSVFNTIIKAIPFLKVTPWGLKVIRNAGVGGIK